ncbi:hypothetical protein AcW1_009298 [Taiwanofungus camphoratus]|nr:hypothetical protein AcV5_003375 [Antrodia cinnamomea]KAI0947577.1 hypothetical protein AcW1_009298 [Antrodia cinnamomea]
MVLFSSAKGGAPSAESVCMTDFMASEMTEVVEDELQVGRILYANSQTSEHDEGHRCSFLNSLQNSVRH